MKLSRDFARITTADFIVRSAYQMGKTPVLPIYAATLGAGDAFLGVIVSISTMTGLALKPAFGILSDRWGRWLWLMIGTLFFALMPFLYRFITTPGQLLVIRLIHGLSTAIYGPVTLAYVVENAPTNTAENLGWFGFARSGGYIVGPAVAGAMLDTVDPVTVYTIIGLLSNLAFIPVLSLSNTRSEHNMTYTSILTQLKQAFLMGGKTPAIWLSGALEASVFIVLYTVKAFLPVYALDVGMSIGLVGLFFSLQELAHIVVRPWAGRVADRIGYLNAIVLGLLLLGTGLAIIPLVSGLALLVPSIITGIAQAFIFLATIVLVSDQIDRLNLGAGMGFVGMMQNLGKVIGPVLGGVMIQTLGFQVIISILAFLMVAGASILGITLNTIIENRVRLNQERENAQ